jgi:hypothetical protein
MAQDIKYDLDCGTYSVFIDPPKKASRADLIPSGCFGKDDWGNHGAVQGSDIEQFTDEVCKKFPEGEISMASPMGVWNKWWNNVDYAFGIYWNTADETCRKPGLKGKRVGLQACKDMLFRAWEGCKFLSCSLF